MFTKFTFREALLQLTRNRGRSIIMVFVSLLLCGCIAFYLGNITSSEQALASINESTPAILNICNAFGETRENLTIPTVYVDLLTASGGLRDMELTCQAAGAFSQEARDVDQRYFNGGDTELLGISCPEAMCSTEAERVLDQRYITYLDGYGPEIFATKEPLCIISEDYAESHGLELGDDLSIPIYIRKYDSWLRPAYYAMFDDSTWSGDDYEIPPDWTLKVVGTFSHKLNATRTADVYLPVEWMRETVDSQDLPITDYRHRLMPFSYSTCRATLINSLELNAYKRKLLDMGFGIPFYIVLEKDTEPAPDRSKGTSIWMEDKDFIKTAEKLAGTIRMYRTFMAPFFITVILLVTMAVMLVLRGARIDMAISMSLGRERRAVALVHLTAALLAQGLGCIGALPLIAVPAGLSPVVGGLICGSFLLCALIGDLVGLWGLLRFDPIDLLIKTD